jgi:hypothetical protein
MPTERTHRRAFVRTVALGGACGSLARSPARAEDPSRPEENESPEVEARMQMILARFGEKLDDEARAAVRKDIEAVVRRGEALRKFPLENGDAPMPIFRPYRAPIDALEAATR